jgi:tRNA U34 5-methylaminomethyl-2-thiouridine-forming methyltransferase MnmC
MGLEILLNFIPGDMERKIITTEDGSHSISIPEMNVTYHSVHGAIQESMHVFIEAGLKASNIFAFVGVHNILEVGFGTGLNALLSLIEADKHQNRIYYTALEPYPLNDDEVSQLNFCEQLDIPHYSTLFKKMHEISWEEMHEITNDFRLTKTRSKLEEFSTDDLFDIVYFDAFAPGAQPGLWTKEIFEKLHSLLKENGILVTYCSKGEVQRAMQAAGFKIEKLSGPPGKREMLRATRQ